MSFPRPETPILPPMYKPGRILKLSPLLQIRANNGDPTIFTNGADVTIVEQKSNLSTNTAEPLTSATVRYKIKVTKTVVVEDVKEAIISKRVHHDDLLPSPTAMPGSAIYTAGAAVYMKKDTQFPRIPIIKAGSKVIIDDLGPTTNKGSTMVRKTKDAYYQIRPVVLTEQEKDFFANRHVSHNELREA